MNKIFKHSLCFLSAAVLLSSCLKEKGYTDVIHDSNPKTVVEIVQATASNGTNQPELMVFSLDVNPPTETISSFELRLGAGALNKDYTVNIELYPTAIANYNSANGTSYVSLPAGSFQIVGGNTITIPAGKSIVPIMIKLDKTQLDLSKSYALGFRIVSASDGAIINTNANTIVVAIGVKNQYDADYKVDGYFFHPAAPRTIDLTKHMGTIGAIRVEGQIGDLGGWYFRVDVNGSTVSNWSAAGAAPPAPSSGLMTSDNPAGVDYSAAAPLNPGTPPYTSTNFNNTYEASTKTFKLHYGYKFGSSGQNQYTRQIYEKWVRQ